MFAPQFFYQQLTQRGIDFYTGVPDSLLKDFCAYVCNHVNKEKHFIAVNEGCAVALACGYHFATGKIPLVYMQNSGLGNATNPLLSLADKQVYSVPLLLLVGWRGEPNVKDEPQHITQGEVSEAMLKAMRIPYIILSKEECIVMQQLDTVFKTLNQENAPFAILIQKDTFSTEPFNNEQTIDSSLLREDGIKEVLNFTTKNDIIVSTTGMTSRELYDIREQLGQGHHQDFLTVGSMGHASQIALGIALNKPMHKVYCLDGDGAMLMHLGGLATVANCNPNNYIHVILNNGAHDSVGGQPTVAHTIDIQSLAQSLGYQTVGKAKSRKEIQNFLSNLEKYPALLEVCVKKGVRKDLGRPKTLPVENKEEFMRFLEMKYWIT